MSIAGLRNYDHDDDDSYDSDDDLYLSYDMQASVHGSTLNYS